MGVRKQSCYRNKLLSVAQYHSANMLIEAWQYLSWVVLTSYRELALAIAQQLGSGHEDNDVDQSIVQLASFSIAGHPGHLVPLIGFADRVLEVGSTFLGFLNLHHEYVPKYFNLPDHSVGQS